MRHVRGLGSAFVLAAVFGLGAFSGGVQADVDDQYGAWSAPVNLGPPVNTLAVEMTPGVSMDGLTLYLSCACPDSLGSTDIYVSIRASVDDPWGPPQNLGSPVNSPFDDQAPTPTIDGHRLYMRSNRPGGFGDNDLYVSHRHNQTDPFGWGMPENLGAVNSIKDDSKPALFEDDVTGTTTLYFQSNRLGGLGARDIYASTLQPDETFGPAVLVAELSSPFEDQASSIRRDGLEFFLSSNRPGTLGGLDILVSTRATTSDPWSVPVNLGPVVNTAFTDAGNWISFDGRTLYFHSNRPGSAGPALDIWATTRDRVGVEFEAPSIAAQPSPLDSTVWTDLGWVQGVPTGESIAFRGMPFAAPPVGALRWTPPADPVPWTGVFQASKFGPVCPQISAGAIVGNEDCLTLSVIAPAVLAPHPRPVMVWVHGGGNHAGNAFRSAPNDFGGVPTDGRLWSDVYGVVFVTIEYRLGALGFWAHPSLDATSDDGVSGNYGLLDQIAALRWVDRNIAAFGGDPDRVLLFGESAGATDVCALLVSPLAVGLFAGAIMESVAEGCRLPSIDAYEAGTGARVALAAGCASAADVAACMRALPASTIVAAVPGTIDNNPRIYTPIVDGHVLPDSPIELLRSGTWDHVPLIVGSNADETARRVGAISTEAAYKAAVYARYGTALGDEVLGRYPSSAYPTPRKAMIAATTDELHTCPTRRIAAAAAAPVAGAPSTPVFRYFFTHAVDNNATVRNFGAFHTLEIMYVFRGWGTYTPSADEAALADAMGAYWVRMATMGRPNGDDALDFDWPRYQPREDNYLRLDNTTEPLQGLRTEACDFWDGTGR